MIVGTCFKGDDNEKLKMLQHGCYYDLLRKWINLAGKRRLWHRASPEWSDVTRFWELFREEGYYDHRCIQMPHDLIAARFRQLAQEMSLTDGEKEEAWIAFFKAEAMNWLERDNFLCSFMMALADSDSRVGYVAEDAMFEMMRLQYQELDYSEAV